MGITEINPQDIRDRINARMERYYFYLESRELGFKLCQFCGERYRGKRHKRCAMMVSPDFRMPAGGIIKWIHELP